MALNTPHGWSIHPLWEVVTCPDCGLPMEAEKFSHPTPCPACNALELLGLDDDVDKLMGKAVSRTTRLRVEYAQDNA